VTRRAHARDLEEVPVSETAGLIRDFLVEQSEGQYDAADLEGSESLLERGMIDSLALAGLIGFIRMRFSVELRSDEIVPTHFRTIETNAALVDAKMVSAG
jgi:acyl carrier protein